MTTDFGLLPPEVNSARMFRGPGSAPLRAAADAWDTLGRALHAIEISLISVISGLPSQVWHSSQSPEGIRPYLQWIGLAAARSHHTAGQAWSAVAAYEAALMATVMPTQVTENRRRLRSLATANQLGQYTPSLAALDALYGEMWFQNARAMYRYARESAAATRLIPLPQPGIRPATMPAVDDAPSHCAVPRALERLASSGSSLSPASTASLASTARIGDAVCVGVLSVPRGWVRHFLPPATPVFSRVRTPPVRP